MTEHAARSGAREPDELARQFRHFARTECTGEPLYRALCELAAGHAGVLRLLDAAAPTQRRPNLLLAAVHHLVLGAARRDALAGYFPSAGGERDADASLEAVFLGFCERWQSALRERIEHRSTQTNEIGRCAVLWPLLRLAATQSGARDIALLDFGCSAGLNLGVDRYRYDYGRFALAPAGEASAPRIACRLVGDAAPPAEGDSPRIVQRLGIDVAPIDVRDEAEVQWLRACLWPHDAVRRERFDAAVAVARAQRWPVERHEDCTAAVERWIEQVPRGVLPVLVNTWVLCYLGADALAEHLRRMHALVRERGLAWISAEGPSLRIGDETVPALPADAPTELRAGSLWTLTLREAQGSRSQVIARSHPHGKWLQWLA